MQLQQKISNLWFVILFGLTVHTLLSLMPLFFVPAIGPEDGTLEGVESAKWFTLILNVIPLLLVVLIQLLSAKWLKLTNFVVSALLLVMNGLHPMELFGGESVDWSQFVLMLFIFLTNLALAAQSWKWFKSED